MVSLFLFISPISIAEGLDPIIGMELDIGDILLEDSFQESEELQTESFTLSNDKTNKSSDDGNVSSSDNSTAADNADATVITVRKDTTKKVYLGTSYQIAIKGSTIKSCKSSNKKVAKVNNSGLVTLKKAGTAKITVTTAKKKKITVTLNVIDPKAATSVRISNGKSATIAVGETLQLNYKLKPSTATNSVKWTSSNKKIATVGKSSGLVTAKGTGKVVITANTTNGKSAKITIKVTKASTPETSGDDTQTPPALPEGSDGQTPPALPEGSDEQTPPALPEGSDGQTPPALPEGSDGQTPPALPEGSDGQTPPALPEGSDGQTPPGDGGQSGGSADEQSGSDSAATTLTEGSSGKTYKSTTGGENAVLVNGSKVKMTKATVKKTGDSSSESADFYGTNAAILAKGGATLTIKNSKITSNGSHANGVFSYGSGTTVKISNSTITTKGNNSGGIMTTGGATMKATNLKVTTSGNSSAPIRSDRGGGTVTVTGGTYKASGVGSPAIYSTADITVSKATLSSSKSEAVVIEGGNSVTLKNVKITGNNSKLNGQSTVKTNVLIYQSMSGDASDGASKFTMTGGTMTAKTGVMFHVTNTTTTINLSGVKFVNGSKTFLTATADAWGTSGKNGGKVTLNMSKQAISGKIVVDSVSTLTMNLKKGSTFTGSISNKGTCAVKLSSDSKWKLTGDSYVTSFSGSMDNVDLNGHTLYVNGVTKK